MTGKRQQVIAGFIPLLDSSVLVAAAECGFAEAAGIELKLIRETSWANIRDRIAVGHFDVAHMLAPMPIAASLKLTSLAVPTRAAMTLALGGNAITVSTSLGTAMRQTGWQGGLDPATSGVALALVVAQMSKTGRDPLRFGVVHPFSGHAYELRYWLAAAGINPEQDVEICVLPPQVMPDALARGQIDGYCVGEPWSTVAVQAGTGCIVTCKQMIWPDSPEKVLGVTDAWIEANPETFAALLRALSDAADWCSRPANTQALAEILSSPHYLGASPDVSRPALGGPFSLSATETVPDLQVIKFQGGACAAPQRAHGLWLYAQMVRWGQAVFDPLAVKRIASIFDDAAYREALQLEAGPERSESLRFTLFDGHVFDPEHLQAYVSEFEFKA